MQIIQNKKDSEEENLVKRPTNNIRFIISILSIPFIIIGILFILLVNQINIGIFENVIEYSPFICGIWFIISIIVILSYNKIYNYNLREYEENEDRKRSIDIKSQMLLDALANDEFENVFQLVKKGATVKYLSKEMRDRVNLIVKDRLQEEKKKEIESLKRKEEIKAEKEKEQEKESVRQKEEQEQIRKAIIKETNKTIEKEEDNKELNSKEFVLNILTKNRIKWTKDSLNCPDCKLLVSFSAKKCPHCGAECTKDYLRRAANLVITEHKNAINATIIVVIIVVIIIIVNDLKSTVNTNDAKNDRKQVEKIETIKEENVNMKYIIGEVKKRADMSFPGIPRASNIKEYEIIFKTKDNIRLRFIIEVPSENFSQYGEARLEKRFGEWVCVHVSTQFWGTF